MLHTQWFLALSSGFRILPTVRLPFSDVEAWIWRFSVALGIGRFQIGQMVSNGDAFQFQMEIDSV